MPKPTHKEVSNVSDIAPRSNTRKTIGRRDIHAEIRDNELGILRELGIPWPPKGRRTHITCPFPDHPDHDPSWRWDEVKRRYFCTCPYGDGNSIVDVVMRMHGVSAGDAITWIRGDHAKAHAAIHASSDREREAWKASREQDDKAYLDLQHKKARWLWGLSRDPQGSPVEVYLAGRGITGPPPGSIRYLPARPPEYPFPCMIAAYGDPRQPQAVHLTRLAADGRGKAPLDHPKITIGSPGGLPIIIARINDGLGLAILEGVESALSFHAATGLGAWAAGAAGFMPVLADVVPSYVECVTIWREADPAGKAGANGLADRLAARKAPPEILIVEAV